MIEFATSEIQKVRKEQKRLDVDCGYLKYELQDDSLSDNLLDVYQQMIQSIQENQADIDTNLLKLQTIVSFLSLKEKKNIEDEVDEDHFSIRFSIPKPSFLL